MKYKTNADIESLVEAFETATISRDEWKHAEHMIVALFYLERHDINTATEKMRSGIFDLLTKGFNIDLTKEMPYHETLTVFWIRTIYAFSLSTTNMPFIEKANRLVEKFDKDYPLRFYSRELLFSDAARAVYIEPEFDTAEAVV